jgi:hypothetical protein
MYAVWDWRRFQTAQPLVAQLAVFDFLFSFPPSSLPGRDHNTLMLWSLSG